MSPEERNKGARERLTDAALAGSIVETVREPLLVLDAGLRVVSANPSFFRTFRAAPDDVYGRRVYDLGNGQWDVPRLRALLEDILPQRTQFVDYPVEHDFPLIGRRTMVLNARRLRRPEEKPEEEELILLAIEDVTERCEAERVLEREREREREQTRLFIEGVREYAIFVLDPSGRVASWNAGADRIHRYRTHEIIGEPFSSFYSEADCARGHPAADLQRAEAQGECEVEGWRVRKGGSRFWANVVITALSRTRQGGFTVVTRDLTERKRTEAAMEAHVEDLSQKNRQLRMTNESLDAFTYVVGHDLKEPVRAMESLLTVVEEDHREELPADVQALLAQARAANRRLASLISGLLAFSRASRADTSEFTSIAVDDALRSDDCTTRFLDRFAERGARLEYPDHDAVVHANVPALCQILGNLVENAVKHNPNPNPMVRVRAQLDGDAKLVEIIVEDNGAGFPPDVIAGLDRMSTTTRGFGLAIAKRSAELHGGRLWLDRSPEGGGAVHFTLPAAPHAAD